MTTREKLVSYGQDPDAIASRGFTFLELHEAFERVQNKKNWKMPIRRTIKGTLTGREREAIMEACIFFAGSPAEIWCDGVVTHVAAAGYYACIGS